MTVENICPLNITNMAHSRDDNKRRFWLISRIFTRTIKKHVILSPHDNQAVKRAFSLKKALQ